MSPLPFALLAPCSTALGWPGGAQKQAAHLLQPTAAVVMNGVRLLYNNDGENLWAVNSSYHPCSGCGVDSATIRGSVRDVAHIADVDLICPFHNVPWWDSRLEPPKAHRDWYDKQFGFPWGSGNSQLDFVLKGGDFIGEFADEASKTGQRPFVAIRLNDGQMCSHPPTPDNCTSGVNNDHQFDRLSRFWWDHRENSSMILGLQQTPAAGFQRCCWDQPQSCTGGRAHHCTNAACEFSWISPTKQGEIGELSLGAKRIAHLVGEVISLYAHRSSSAGEVRGVELDFQRGLDYFSSSVSLPTRRRVMKAFLRQVRESLEQATKEARLPSGSIALGLRLTPSWAQLRAQGLDELADLVAPVGGGEGRGCGVTYFNWGIFFYAFQPFDSDFASLVAATPPETPFYFETSSWIGTARRTQNCSRPAKVRITKEELWTTALIALSYGARGISAFNFIYTRPFFDFPCEFELNEPYSEPLFGALNQTKNVSFLECCADQLYRLQEGVNEPGGPVQIPAAGRDLLVGQPISLRIVAVPPHAGNWPAIGRLRLLSKAANASSAVNLSVRLNGVVLAPFANVSSQYDEGTQAKMALWSSEMWSAYEVPPKLMRPGNNTITLLAQRAGTHGESCYKIVHTGDVPGGDGKRWRFPSGHDGPGAPIVNGTAANGLDLLGCERHCDALQPFCKGIYVEDGTICYTLDELFVGKTSRRGTSFKRIDESQDINDSSSRFELSSHSTYSLSRLELSLPVGSAG